GMEESNMSALLAGPQRPLILVVDDAVESLMFLACLLEDDYRVASAECGQRGLGLARTERPDLILLDVAMPGMDGYQVCEALKADPATRDIPVIFLTGMTSSEDEERGLALGAVDYITKPVSAPVLLARLRTHLLLKVSTDLLRNQNLALENRVSARTADLESAQTKLRILIDIGIAMSVERDSDRLMEMILDAARALSNADGGTIYLRDEKDLLQIEIFDNDSLTLAGERECRPGIAPVPLYHTDGRPNHHNIVSHAVHTDTTINIAEVDQCLDRFDFSKVKEFDAEHDYLTRSILTIPLKPRGGRTLGALQLINARADGDFVVFSDDIQRFVEALAAQAATAFYNRQLLNAHDRLLDAMIHLIAGAIDTKSPYTGGHCARVPELAFMLAEEVCQSVASPFAGFNFSTPEEWREFKVGALLHDCGKITTPEYVVDKATKLEIIYNRIHEIRTRFEVLWRDAELKKLQQIMAGGDASAAEAECEAATRQLQEDFAFIAECNIGGEFMAAPMVERLKQIGQATWVRHFDDKLGLSHVELARNFGPEQGLPCVEKLLDDKPWHVLPRESYPEPDRGFKLKVPKNLFNFGEIYNLSIGRGTLTEEERFKINEHITQTITMLEDMPFPPNLRRVPEYAGAHHETLVGTGYPRGLTKADMSIPARIMAIADVFEALTAADRPYKKAKTLSEAMDIMAGMVRNQHLDADLFQLFLSSGVYMRYAERFLMPQQIDAVDVSRYLAA
ncbi:MAG: hypothetical protein RIR00_2409, partial [Pseudomonadota bacterium]